MRRLRHLASLHRTPATNRMLGLLLAFNAGAVNAGGFLVVGMYTSHMSGFVSMLADNLVLGNLVLVLTSVGVLLSFTSGAALTAVLVNWARVHHLRSGYAIPLLFEALLMLVFGVIGGTLNHKTPFAVPLTVLLLCFIMGLQNALVTKISSATIRTTHMTGIVTDLGIEIGKLLYWNGRNGDAPGSVHANLARLKLFASLLGLFTIGGIVGAAGFSHIGFIWVLPFAVVLLTLSLPPLVADFRRIVRLLSERGAQAASAD